MPAFFLGSEGTRFPGQDTTDIHLTDWRVNNLAIPTRQRATAVAQGLTLVTVERSAMLNPQAQLLPGGPPVWAWMNWPNGLNDLTFHILGPSLPNHLQLNIVPGVYPLQVFNINGIGTLGHVVPWYCEVDEYNSETIDNIRYPRNLYYYKHKKRTPGIHYVTPEMEPGGPMKVIPKLHFGTQINEFRQALPR